MSGPWRWFSSTATSTPQLPRTAPEARAVMGASTSRSRRASITRARAIGAEVVVAPAHDVVAHQVGEQQAPWKAPARSPRQRGMLLVKDVWPAVPGPRPAPGSPPEQTPSPQPEPQPAPPEQAPSTPEPPQP